MDKTTKTIIFIMLACFILGLGVAAYSYFYISVDKGKQCLIILLTSIITTGVCCLLSYILMPKQKEIPKTSFSIRVDPDVPATAVASFLQSVDKEAKARGGLGVKFIKRNSDES